MKAKTKLTKLWSFLLSFVMLLSLLPTTAFAAGSAETTDVTEINLTGNYQYGTVPAGVLPAFNPGTTTEGIRMGTNAGWSYFINETSVWSGFGSETPTAVNDGKTKYGYRFQVKTNDGYQLASDLKVIYNGEDVTSTVEVTRWSWGAYVTVDLGKATVESPATYDLTTSVNGGHGTISAGENGITEGASKIITFTPDSGYEIDKVMVNGTETTVTGNTLTVTMDGNKNVVVTYKAIEYTITVTDGKATVGAGTEITKAAEGTTVTLTANAAPTDMVFDKWEVISGSITLADANSATTTFTMPAGAVSVKATYKDAPHTHTYNQEIVKPEALKTPADCTGNAVYFKSCSCGAISTTDAFVAMNTALGHAYGSDWKYDSTNHWHECSRCHDKKYEAAHDYGSDNVCDTCGYNKTVPHTHNLTLVAAKAATCTEGGKEAYYKCEGCGKFYEDVLGTKEITDLASWGNIAKIAHTTKLNATSLTYNGKVRTPKVIVKDRTGKTLVKNTDYTVSYAKGRKYVGKYAVKITFKGKYSGTKTLYFTIKPKATSISSLKAGSKKFTVKWKKQATQTTGYQVQYSASSKFSKAKTVTVGKNTTVSKKISKLSGKKKYYVRVRTYKTVKINGKSIRIYSGWSKAKTVTTKK